MVDPKIKIRDFAVKEEKKAEAWLGTNWVPFSTGVVAGILVEFILWHL